MKNYILPLVNWGNGIVMIGIFPLVCLGLITLVIRLISSGNKKKE